MTALNLATAVPQAAVSADDTAEARAGWVLAAPGVIPLAVGLLLIYLSTGGKGASHVANAVSLGVMPLPDGGAIASGAFRF